MRPYVSIIVPTYNSELTISQCLSSLLRLDYWKFQIIVVDDGSSDKTKSILETYTRKDKRLSVIYLNKAGISASRNAGVRKSKGDIVIFIDSDCIADTDLLNKIAGIFSKNDELKVVSGGKKTWNSKNDVANFVGYQLEHAYLEVMGKNLPYTPTHLCACKRDVFKKIIFDERIKRPSFEDVKFGDEACKIFQVRFFGNLSIWHVNPPTASEFFRHIFVQFYGQFLYQKEKLQAKQYFIFPMLFWTFLTSLQIPIPFFLIKKRAPLRLLIKAPAFICVQNFALTIAFITFLKDSFRNRYKVFEVTP